MSFKHSMALVCSKMKHHIFKAAAAQAQSVMTEMCRSHPQPLLRSSLLQVCLRELSLLDGLWLMSSSRHTHDYSLLLTFLLLNLRCYVIETQHLAILPRLPAGVGVKLKRAASALQDSLIGYNELKRMPLAQSYWSQFRLAVAQARSVWHWPRCRLHWLRMDMRERRR